MDELYPTKGMQRRWMHEHEKIRENYNKSSEQKTKGTIVFPRIVIHLVSHLSILIEPWKTFSQTKLLT